MDYEKSLISVVMPVYNSEKSLRKSIESILQQTYENFELLIIYDKSTDHSLDIIEEYMRHDSRIKLIKRETKMGIAAALNSGLENARGKYIARMDADDYSYHDRLEKQLIYMERNPHCVICGGATRVIMPSVSFIHNYPCNSEEIRAAMLFGCEFAHPTVFFRREEFQVKGWKYDQKRFVEDFHLWTLIDGEMANLSDVVLDYNKDGGGTSAIQKERVDRDTAYVIKEQFRQKLGINIDYYNDAVFWLALYKYQIELAELIIQLYELLIEIEEKNKVIHEYDNEVLKNVLCNQWNRYLWELSLISVDSKNDLGIPMIKNKSIFESFDEAVCDCLKCSKERIIDVLKKRIDYTIMNIQSVPENYQIIVYGVGVDARKFFSLNEEYLSNVVCFCDSNESYHGKDVFGKMIISPYEMSKYDYDLIVISTNRYFEEIHSLLTDVYHVDQRKIVSTGIFNLFEK